MVFRLACAAFVSGSIVLGAACGGRTDVSDDVSSEGSAGDATSDALVKKDGTSVDAVADVYQPIGKKCGVQDAAPPPVWTPDDSGTPIHPPIMMNYGGVTLKNPVLIPMTFDGDEMRDAIEDYIGSIGCTSYWRATTSDYGIGDAVMGDVVHMSDTPPATIDDTNIQLFIRQKIVTNAIPQPIQGKTIYVIFYPESTDITEQGQHSCEAFGGYHDNFSLVNGQNIAYAVIPRCGSFDGLGGFDAITGTTSHELLEGVTDPYPMQSPAYLFPEGNGLAWGLVGGGEVGDLCIFGNDAFFQPNDFPFYVQHTWVSHAAYQGHDPCQPTTATYYNAAPTLPDVITIPPDFGLGTLTSTGIKIGVGQNKTIPVTLVSDGNWTGTISLQARDYAYFEGGPAALTFNFAPATGKVGDTVQLTVTRVGTNQQLGLEPFIIESSSQGQREGWWVLVGDP